MQAGNSSVVKLTCNLLWKAGSFSIRNVKDGLEQRLETIGIIFADGAEWGRHEKRHRISSPAPH